MPTAIGFECDGGVAIAADRTVVRGGSVRSRARQRVFGHDEWAIAVLGENTETVHEEVRIAIGEYGSDDETVPLLKVLGRIASEIASEYGVSLLIAGENGETDSGAGLLAVHEDGSVLEDPPFAIGSGSGIAYGALEASETDVPFSEASDLARSILTTVANRDPETGTEIDVWTLEDG